MRTFVTDGRRRNPEVRIHLLHRNHKLRPQPWSSPEKYPPIRFMNIWMSVTCSISWQLRHGWLKWEGSKKGVYNISMLYMLGKDLKNPQVWFSTKVFVPPPHTKSLIFKHLPNASKINSFTCTFQERSTVHCVQLSNPKRGEWSGRAFRKS